MDLAVLLESCCSNSKYFSILSIDNAIRKNAEDQIKVLHQSDPVFLLNYLGFFHLSFESTSR